MPHATESEFDHIRVKQLAPTFGAEVTGVDFSKPVPPDIFAEIHRAITQVSRCLLVYFGEIWSLRLRILTVLLLSNCI